MLGIILVPEKDKTVNTTVWIPKEYKEIVKNKVYRVGWNHTMKTQN